MVNQLSEPVKGVGQHHLLQAAFNNFGLPGAVCDRHGKLVHINKCMESTTTATVTQLQGTDLKQWVITEPPLDEAQLKGLFEDLTVTDRILPCRVDGKALMLTINVIREGEDISGYALVMKANQ